jgi:hypothetical protein
MNEVGKTGLLEFSGQVSESYTSKLEWPAAYDVYDEMRRRDPTIRTMWNALVMLSRTAQWYFEPESESAEDRAAADFLDDCLHDMSHTPADAIEDALTCVMFGWSWLEICYKRRGSTGSPQVGSTGSPQVGSTGSPQVGSTGSPQVGSTGSPQVGSTGSPQEGNIGWRKWAVRRQSSFHKWQFDETGGLQGLVQRPAPDYEEIEIPIQKSLHFTFQRDGGNPEGFALLESLYETWYYLKNLQIINGIGWQRSFVGLPTFEFEEKPSSEDQSQVESVGQALSVDAKQYVSVPSGVNFSLTSVSNTNAEALLNTIRYYRLLMLQTMLADFINLGTGQTGSWALGSDKSQLFLMATDGTLDRLASVVNRFAVPRLLAYNPQIKGRARLTHTKVEKPALGQLGNWLQQVGDLLTWTPEDENWIRKRTGMPSLGPGAAGMETRPTEDSEEGLAEFAEQGRARQRAQLENELKADIAEFLDEQQERVAEAVERNRNLADDDAFWQQEEERFRKRFLSRLVQAVQELVRLAATDTEEEVGGGVDWAGVNQQAAEWARQYAGELITNVTETTRASVREAVATWIETGAELDELTQTLAPTFGPQRAELIASTEVTRAFDEANDITRQRIGLPRTRYKAPAHPRCRCSTHPMLLDNGDWVIVWYTARDERVCKRPVSTPWGRVNGCRELHRMIVGAEKKKYLGKKLSEVQ